MAITDSVDYLQRCLPLPGLTDSVGTTGEYATRRLLHVRGIGRANPDHDRRGPLAPNERWRPVTSALITGLYGYRIPLAYELNGGREGVRVRVGTWSTTANAATQDRRRGVIESVLSGLYSAIDLNEVDDETASWPLSGLALGIPAPSGIDPETGASALDRVIASLPGARWSALVLAYPVSERMIGNVRQQVLNEMRSVGAQAAIEGAPSPLGDQYLELLKVSLASLGESLATGAWRTAVYLLGTGESYPRLAAVWRSVFSSEQSLPEPVRVFDLPLASMLAREWTLPDQRGAASPGHYQRPFEFQTMLTTSQLAGYIHLPTLETPGFSVSRVARFDSVRPNVHSSEQTNHHIRVGRILHRGLDTGIDYEVSPSSLTKHVFVAGVTGAGKTNTIFSLLAATASAGIPFLVIEPAKTEYRALMSHPVIGNRIRVFTAGRPQISPLVLNPLEVPLGIGVSEHIDLVRVAFGAAFGMWTPLPQILERCLREVYVDRGWDLRSDENARLAAGGDRTDAFPTLAELVAKVQEVLPSLGYDSKITSDLQASLTTRLESLRTGGRGAMLDVTRSLPIEELLAHPTVLELEAIGDEGDKAFLIGLLLVRLVEHRRAAGQNPHLVHLLVIEEAHRLLGNVPTQTSEEAANPRGQAVETFTNLLSEIRAYGQGVIIADQVPVRLAPDVLKNTNLKIAHRTVAEDDRRALAGTMAMDEAQARALTTLGVGEAAVFSAGDDGPLLVHVQLVKDELSQAPTDEDVTQHMGAWHASELAGRLSWPRPFCIETCAGAPLACEAARAIVDDDYVQRTFARVVLSTAEEPEALDRMWDDIIGVVHSRRPAGIDRDDLLRAFAGHAADWYAQRRGSQGAWLYVDTHAVSDRLRAVLLDQLDAGDPEVRAWVRATFQTAMREVNAREFVPYAACERVCDQDPPLCLYRSAVADLVSGGRYQASWERADAADARSDGPDQKQSWQVCEDAAYELIEFPDTSTPGQLAGQITASARRVGLCFEQQMLANDSRKVPRTTRRILDRILREAQG